MECCFGQFVVCPFCLFYSSLDSLSFPARLKKYDDKDNEVKGIDNAPVTINHMSNHGITAATVIKPIIKIIVWIQFTLKNSVKPVQTKSGLHRICIHSYVRADTTSIV